MSTGLKHHTPLYETARQLCDFLPGIDRLIYIGGNGSPADWTACEWVKTGNGYRKNRLEITQSIYKNLEDIRKQKPGRVWTEESTIPFYVEHGKKHSIDPQLTIQHEQNNLTLVIRLKGQGILNDLIYIFFRYDKSNFGISHDTSPIDTSQKSIIGMLTYNFANIIYQKIHENSAFVNDIKKEFVELLKFHTQAEDTNEKGKFEKWKIDWARETLSDLSERDGINYVYQEEALEMLVNNDHSFGVVKKALDDAVRIASLLAVDNDGKIYIEKYFIKFTSVTSEKLLDSNTEDDGLPSRLDKVYLFLDRLEDASRKLIDKDIKPTSELVGREMQEQITAPAIRDFLKKNQARVVMLLKKNPDKWKYIRRNFRPVLNVLPKNNHLLNSSAG